MRITAPRSAHEREGHDKFTLTAIIKEEEQILDRVDKRDNAARLDVRSADLEALSADQARAVAAIGTSPWLVAPLCAPAGAGKTHSLRALRTAAARAGKEVLVLAPTGKAVDEAVQDDAGDRGYTVAKALHLLARGELQRLKLFVEGSWSQALQATPKSVCAHNPVTGQKLLVKQPLCETRA